ncbi:MAG: DUF4281 domain-containing protein [Halobacteriovoraceae bacterium]|jgi:hypothetical protein|nr:DUF4281 domain-containing protein [Halobacteriovoraceae bacterium]
MQDFLFHFSAISVLPFWALMIFLPHYKKTSQIILSPWIIIPPAICYAGLLFPNSSPELWAFLSSPSPESFATITKEPWAASLFWAHAGAFDLFIGRWIFLDSIHNKVKHFIIAPILGITIFVGPIGYLLYALTRLGQHLKKDS